MRIVLVGNNDGPLRILKSLQKDKALQEVLSVGLQKEVKQELKASYTDLIGQEKFFEGFEEERLLQRLEQISPKPDLLINCFCNFKFVKLLDAAFPVLNVHPSPLPAYRGRHPMHWALIRGEKSFGISIHRMNREYDAGAVLWQAQVAVREGTSVQQLRSLLLQELEKGFSSFLKAYKSGEVQEIIQVPEKVSYYPRRYPKDNILTEWDEPDLIYRKVKALRDEALPAIFAPHDGAGEMWIDDIKRAGKKPSAEQKLKFTRQEGFIEVSCPDGSLLHLFPSKLQPATEPATNIPCRLSY